MKWDIREPCRSCPYRKDAPLGMWHPDEFHNLRRATSDTIMGGVFGCHKYRHRPQEERQACAGYLITQRRDGVPSIQLRMKVIQDDEALACLEAVSDGGHELYESIEEMCEANLAADKIINPWRYDVDEDEEGGSDDGRNGT